MLRQTLLAVVALVAGVAAPAYGQEVELKWKFKEGEKFYVEDISNMKQTVTALGQTQKVDQKTTTITSYTIKKVTTDSIEMVMKFENVEVKSDGPIGQFDKFMEKTKGVSFTVTMAPDGKVKRLEGFNEFAKQIVGDDEDTAKLLKMFINEEMFTKGVEQAFGFIPDKAVKPGDTWTRETKIPFGPLGDFKTNSTYTYNGNKDGRDEISVKQSMRYQAPKAGTEFAGLFKIVKGDLKADNARGKYFFDADKGRLTSAELAMTIRGSLTLDLNGMELTVDLNVEQTGTSRVLDRSPVKD
jgi:hypothetical protein